jgi:hypothetical protein
MQIIIMAIFSLAFLTWVEMASAQTKTYSVSVSVHKDVNAPKLTVEKVNKILADASKMLQKPGHASTDDNAQCDVAFTLKGQVGEFSGVPKVVNKDANNLDIDAVHRVPDPNNADFHIKVVEKILNFCRFRDQTGFGVSGCSFPPTFRSIIVVHPATHTNVNNPSIDVADPSRDLPVDNFPDHILWAHEFGHLTGLGHRDVPQVLMTPCGALEKVFPMSQGAPFPDARVKVSRDECRCLRSGPGFGPNGTCPLPSLPVPFLTCPRP